VNPYFALLYRFFVPFAPHFAAWAFFFGGSKAIEVKIEKPSVFGKRFPNPNLCRKVAVLVHSRLVIVSDARERLGSLEKHSLFNLVVGARRGSVQAGRRLPKDLAHSLEALRQQSELTPGSLPTLSSTTSCTPGSDMARRPLHLGIGQAEGQAAPLVTQTPPGSNEALLHAGQRRGGAPGAASTVRMAGNLQTQDMGRRDGIDAKRCPKMPPAPGRPVGSGVVHTAPTPCRGGGKTGRRRGLAMRPRMGVLLPFREPLRKPRFTGWAQPCKVGRRR